MFAHQKTVPLGDMLKNGAERDHGLIICNDAAQNPEN